MLPLAAPTRPEMKTSSFDSVRRWLQNLENSGLREFSLRLSYLNAKAVSGNSTLNKYYITVDTRQRFTSVGYLFDNQFQY